jgi:hypothetical protein
MLRQSVRLFLGYDKRKTAEIHRRDDHHCEQVKPQLCQIALVIKKLHREEEKYHPARCTRGSRDNSRVPSERAYLREDYATTWLRCGEDKVLARDMLRICFSKALAVIEGEVQDDLRNQDVMERWDEVLEGIRGSCHNHQSDKKPIRNSGVS